MKDIKLGVNIDHICVLRAARGVNDPDIIQAMYSAIIAGADQITVHLREDRRHIDENDAKNIVNLSRIPVNIECSVNDEIIGIISALAPHRATLVPERREELTTEGGLNPLANGVEKAIEKLKNSEIEVSLFIEPSKGEIKAAKDLGCEFVELHTGRFSNLYLMLYSNLPRTKYSVDYLDINRKELKTLLNDEIKRIAEAADYAHSLGLKVAAGHGLNYQNIELIAKIPYICELNIGQSIIARSTICGLENAVIEMKRLLENCN